MGGLQKIEPEWMSSLRERGESRFSQLPLPDRKDELFKYTSVSGLDLTRRSSNSTFAALADERCQLDAMEVALLVISTAGVQVKCQDANPLEQQGIIFQDLRLAAKNSSEIIREHLQQDTLSSRDKFAALAEARWAHGSFIHIPKNQRVNGALRVLHFLDSAADCLYYRNLILVDAGAEATIIHEFAGPAAATVDALVNGSTAIWLGHGAKLHFVSAQNWGAQTHFFQRENIHLEADAELNYFVVHSGAKKGQHRLEVDLQETGSRIRAQGCARTDQEQHIDFVANYKHGASYTSSKLSYWMVMAGRSRGIFNGQIAVEKAALHTDSDQKSYAMLLSSQAAVHTMPRLWIATDEVASRHGASISCVDPEQMYYLQSRGLDPEAAKEMIVNGFTAPVLRALPTEVLRQRFQQYMEGKSLGND